MASTWGDGQSVPTVGVSTISDPGRGCPVSQPRSDADRMRRRELYDAASGGGGPRLLPWTSPATGPCPRALRRELRHLNCDPRAPVADGPRLSATGASPGCLPTAELRPNLHLARRTGRMAETLAHAFGIGCPQATSAGSK